MTSQSKILEDKLKKIKAADIMSKFAITTKENEVVTSLAHLMMRFKISGIPVLSQSSDICGIVTATDLFNLMKKLVNDIEKGENLEYYDTLKVKDLMTANVVTITEDTTLYEIMKIMCEKNIHTLPVVVLESKEIIGVIGRRDILNAFYVEANGGKKKF